MKMKSLDEIVGNEIVAEDIRTGLDFVLVPKGTLLKTSYLPALKNLGVIEVMVEEELCKSTESVCVIPKEIIDSYASCLANCYQQYEDGHGLSEIEVLAERIVDLCIDNPNVKLSAKMERTESIFEHSIVLCVLCILSGIKLDIMKSKLYQMAMACLVHDFSLLSLPFNFYNIELEEMPEDEQKQMMEHSRKSYEIVSDQSFMTNEAKEMILSHHERMNGRGYPNKKVNHCILCRIIQASDAMDGMLSGIEYRKKSFEEVIAFMESHKTCRFDRPIVEIVCQLFAK